MTAPAASLPAAPSRFRLRREHGLLFLFILLVLVFASTEPNFLRPENLLRVLRTQAHLGVLAAGMTPVILTGGIDLSVGSAVALAAVCMGAVWKATGSTPLALATALGVGALCGAANGLMVAAGRMPPLIVTLATLSVFRGLAWAVGGSTSTGGFSPLILSWSRDDFLGLPAPLWIVTALQVGTGVYLARTDGGRAVYAVGANAAAARLSGVPVNPLKFRLYLVSGLVAGLAAVLYAAQNDTVQADIGGEYELLAITVVVLGGTSVAGGEGSMAGTALGFLTLIFIQNWLNLKRQFDFGGFILPLGSAVYGLVVAVLLIVALLVDAWFRRHAARRLQA